MEIPTAGLVVIGNELLSGKVVDENTPFLTRRLTQLGVDVREVRIIPDELDLIAAQVAESSQRYTYVLTSGGIGPTHDDLTIEAVAQAFELDVVVSPALESLLKTYYKVDLLSGPQSRMACIPEGAELIYPRGTTYPQVVVKNVYIFPGIPSLLRKKFELIADLFQSEPMHERRIQLVASESDIAETLNQVVSDFPTVRIGSYPRQEEEQWHVELILEARDEKRLIEAHSLLTQQLGLEP